MSLIEILLLLAVLIAAVFAAVILRVRAQLREVRSFMRTEKCSYFVCSDDFTIEKIFGAAAYPILEKGRGENLLDWANEYFSEEDFFPLSAQIGRLDGRGEMKSNFSFKNESDVHVIAIKKRKLGRATKYFGIIRNENETESLNSLYTKILDAFPCPIYVKNVSQDDIYIYSNKYHAEVVCGMSKDELKEGRKDFDFFDEKTALELRKIDTLVPTDGTMFYEHFPLYNTSGKESIYCSYKTGEIRKNGDKFVYGISFDINEYVESEKSLRENADAEKVINDCLRLLLSADSEADILDDVVATIGRAFKSDRCYIYKFDHDNVDVPNVAMWCSDGVDGSEPLYHTKAMFRNVVEYLKKDNAIKINDAAKDDGPISKLIRPILSRRGIQAISILGIRNEGELSGFFGVDYVNSTHEHTYFEEQVLRSVASIVEIFLQRKRADELIEQSEAEKRLILESIDLPIVLFNSDVKMQFLNTAAARLIGKSKEQIMREPCHINLCKRENYFDTCLVRQIVNTGEGVSFETILNNRDLAVTMTPIKDKDGKVVNVAEFYLDMTEHNDRSRALKKAMEDAKAADRAKTYFLATMSHELRTPLNSIIGYSELTQDDSITKGERVENLRNINFAANSLLSLINDVLDLSKLEADQMSMNMLPTNVKFLIRELSRIFQFKAKEKRIPLVLHLPEKLPMLVLDSLRLKQIVINLIGNAIKFTKTGRIDVQLNFEKTSDKFGTLEISVQDTGVGISEEFYEKIFRPFERGTNDKIRGDSVIEGTGLGLSISRRLAEQMGGEISLKSKKNEGSTFNVRIPNVEISDSVQKNSALAPAPTAEHEFAGKAVIIDDVMMNLNILSAILRRLGIEHVAFSHAREALEYIKANKPRIILSDLWMPEISGAELAQLLKKNPDTAHIPVVAITADTQFNGNEFDDVILKPITVDSISGIFAKFFAPPSN